MATSNSSKIPVGTVLADKYRVTREIGRGGMAAVYEAENVAIGKRVAVKVLAAELTSSHVVVERFLREARAAASITSPYICDVYDTGKLDDGRPFLVLELLEGESLYERMTRVRQMDAATTTRIVSQVARGLTKAHAAGIVHRDLKPENVFLTTDEEGNLVAKILDFGLAKFYAPVAEDGPQARLTREGAVFGTPAYMSPEQVKGQGQVDHRADVWALGCIAYECLTGRTVWATEQGVAMTFAQIASAPLPNARTFRPDLPAAFDPWFAKALARTADERFQTAKELSDELAAALGEGVGAQSIADIRTAPALLSESSSHASIDALLGASLHETVNAPTERPPPVSSIPSSTGVGESLPVIAPAARPPQMSASESPTSSTLDRGATSPPRRARGGAGRAVLTLMGATAIVGGGYLGWLLLLRPASPVHVTAPSASAAASAPPSASASAPAAASAEPPKGPKYAPVLANGQAQLASGDTIGAIKTFKEAFDLGGSGAARVLLEQAQIAAIAKGPCRVTGLARPRPYTLTSAAGRPSIAFTPKGAIVAWTDDHESAGHDHVYAALLDGSMRDVTPPRDVTPEATLAVRPQLLAVGDRIALLYADARGADAGLLVRWLDADGRIAGPAQPITSHKPAGVWPAIDRLSDGSFWVAWDDDRQSDSTDLYLRRLTPNLEPDGPEVRATDYVKRGPKPRARTPSLASAGTWLFAVYRFEREPQHLVSRLKIALTDPSLRKGLDEKRPPGPAKDREIGEVKTVNGDRDKADGPQVACGPEGCFVAWQADSGGVSAAYMDAAQGQIIWRKKFDPKGMHPAIAVAPSGAAQLAWYSAGRVMLASIGRDAVGPSSAIARVSGDQQRPTLVSGGAPGEWYVSWLDYEAGHLEPYAARALCK